jgi:hypothetical protein
VRHLFVSKGPLCEYCGERCHIIRKDDRVLQVCSFCKGVELLRHSLRLIARASAAVLLLVILTLPAWAEPITLDFAGTMGAGIGAGSFTYDPTVAVPTQVNFGGMANQVFTPFSWNFQLTSSSLPSQNFSSLTEGHTAGWCVGICTAFSGQQVRLNLNDGAGLTFHFSFDLPQSQLVNGLPTYEQIGGFQQAVYRDERFAGTTRMASFQTGALSDGSPVQGSVPLPGTLSLFAIGMATLMLLHRIWKEVNGR